MFGRLSASWKVALPEPKKEVKPEPVKQQHQPSDDKSKQLKKLNGDLSRMEEKIAELEKEVKELENKLAEDGVYNNPAKSKEVNASYQQKKDELAKVQEEWEALAEQIMELEA
jgi:ATP-binding cassette subfamily F protein 3